MELVSGCIAKFEPEEGAASDEAEAKQHPNSAK